MTLPDEDPTGALWRYDVYALDTLIAQSDPDRIRDVMVPPRLPGGGKALRDCTPDELSALAILMRANIKRFRKFMLGQEP